MDSKDTTTKFVHFAPVLALIGILGVFWDPGGMHQSFSYNRLA